MLLVPEAVVYNSWRRTSSTPVVSPALTQHAKTVSLHTHTHTHMHHHHTHTTPLSSQPTPVHYCVVSLNPCVSCFPSACAKAYSDSYSRYACQFGCKAPSLSVFEPQASVSWERLYPSCMCLCVCMCTCVCVCVCVCVIQKPGCEHVPH